MHDITMTLNLTFGQHAPTGANPLPADHDYYPFQPVLLVDQITDIRNKMGVYHV